MDVLFTQSSYTGIHSLEIFHSFSIYIYIYTYYMEITLREIVNSFIQEQISSKEITFQ